MQHPVKQKSLLGQAGRQLTPQGCCPGKHAGVGHWLAPPVLGASPVAGTPPAPPAPTRPPVFGAPPVEGGGVQSAGMVSLPTQSSHRPQVLLQPVACTHGGHLVGSVASARVHVAVI